MIVNLINRIFKSIRTRTIATMIVMFIFMILIVNLILNTIMLDSINSLEKKYISEHVKQVTNSIDSELNNLAETAFDWAVWDNTYKFVEDSNQDYLKSDLTAESISNLRLDVVILMNQSGNYIFANELLKPVNSYKAIPQALKDFCNSVIGKNTNPNYKMQGLILLPEGPMLIATCPILTSDWKGPIHGNLLVGRYINDDEVCRLSSSLKLNLTIESIDKLNQENPRLLSSISSSSSIYVHEITDDKIGGYQILQDVYKHPAVVVSIETNRELSMIGRSGIQSAIFALIAACLLFSILILVFLDKAILSKLLALSKKIKAIGDSREFSARLKPEKVHDELAIVTDEINQMLGNLELGQVHLIESDEALKEANNSLQAQIIEREKIQKEISYLAYHDSLTELPNRLSFTQQLNHAVLLSRRIEKALAILYLDLDGFKMINDTMGHPVGDMLLVETSRRLVKAVRRSDFVARIGGDEFIIMIENIDEIDSIDLIARKILCSFDEPFVMNSQECFVTTSIGIAMYPADGDDAESLIKNADIAMYKAKEKGKNQYVLCTSGIKTKVIETMKIANGLYRALERQEFELYYQPQISCTTNKIVGAEALIRWHHPELGLVLPDEFIGIAEQTGSILSIGEWVMRTACMQNKAWQDMGFGKIRMGVNLSIKQFQNYNIVREVEQILSQTCLDPQYLELEITESIAMKEKNYIVEVLTAFREMGIHISIDDFGTEYSSMNHLKQLPVDRIKIPMPFVQGIDVSSKDEAITKSIIVLAKSLGLCVTAEGVETKNQNDFLTQRMCDEIQGFYYYRPMPANEMQKLLKKQGC